MKRAFCLGILLSVAVTGRAQDQPAAEAQRQPLSAAVRAAQGPGSVAKIIQVKYADVNRLASAFKNLGASVRADASLKILAVYGSPAVVSAIEEAVQKLDVPPAPVPNLEITFYLLYGSAQASQAESVPQDLAATVKQIRAIFPYKSYRLMDTVVLRGRDGESVSSTGLLPGGENLYILRYVANIMPGTQPRLVRINGLNLSLRLRTSSNIFVETGINTDIDAREGQRVVVGKSNLADSSDALILVITPKVIE